jgi:hypothetical protein
MAVPLYRVIVGQCQVADAVPLAEAPIGPWYEALIWRGQGPSMFAVPRTSGGYEWVEWREAAKRGWGEGGRFLVLYYPQPFRAWPLFWRVVQPRPRRVALARTEDQAEVAAERWIHRRQMGFHSDGWRGVRRAWGWDDRELHGHEECWDGCGCDGPAARGDYVLIAEFESEDLARAPDVNLELEAWMARLDAGRAVAITARCDGTCEPACAHCSATYEETMAAWEWLSRHGREVRAWRRRQREVAAC